MVEACSVFVKNWRCLFPSPTMDNRPNLHESLFSRNSTSTPPNNPEQHPFSPHIASSPSLIDTLFHSQPPPSDHKRDVEKYDTPPVAQNVPLPDAALNVPSATDRQAALLSLFTQPSQAPQQVPTPPGSSSRSNSSPQQPADSQKLLEQILGG